MCDIWAHFFFVPSTRVSTSLPLPREWPAQGKTDNSPGSSVTLVLPVPRACSTHLRPQEILSCFRFQSRLSVMVQPTTLYCPAAGQGLRRAGLCAVKLGKLL